MKYFSVTLFILFLTLTSAEAQSLDRQVIGTTGSYQVASWGSVSSTAGEAAISTLVSSGNVLTQGFQQPMISNVTVKNISEEVTSTQVFPNPASGIINVVINAGNADEHYSVQLYDLPGQKLDVPYKDMSGTGRTYIQFDIRQLAAATYMILITDEHNIQVKAIKFSKTN